jgi:replication-associated recombination protein RarA
MISTLRTSPRYIKNTSARPDFSLSSLLSRNHLLSFSEETKRDIEREIEENERERERKREEERKRGTKEC